MAARISVSVSYFCLAHFGCTVRMHNKKRQRIEIRQEAKGRDRKLAEDSVYVRLVCDRVYRVISHNLAGNPYYHSDLLPLKAVELTLMMCERYARYYYHLLIAVRYMSANFTALFYTSVY